MSGLVVVKNNELYVGTWMLSQGFAVDHRYLKRMVEKYNSDFLEFGFTVASNVESGEKKRGGQVEEYLLNEEQATYLTMLMKNTQEVRKFKIFLNKEFFRQRRFLAKLISQKQNAEWLEKREAGKIERRLETDVIKEFIEYAKNQGSQNASKYYMIITKMQNSTLFHLDLLQQKFPNLRDVVEGFQLDTLKMADHAVARALKEGIEKQMSYKDIYILARQRIEGFACIIGKTPIQVALTLKK